MNRYGAFKNNNTEDLLVVAGRSVLTAFAGIASSFYSSKERWVGRKLSFTPALTFQVRTQPVNVTRQAL